MNISVICEPVSEAQVLTGWIIVNISVICEPVSEAVDSCENFSHL